MHIRCPHCHNPFESVEGSSWASLLCPTCGSSFSLSGTELTHTYRPGAFVLGHFELVEEVGSGRYGSVWKARDTQLQRTVAVKIPRERNLDPYETEVFLRDARAAAQLKHPRIAGVHEIGREADTVYIVSDFIDGANLSEWISCRPMTARQSAELMVKIAEALHHAHESGVIHRDLKPTNIMLDRKGEPHVIDFGLARRESGDVTVTVEGQVLGTPSYMSPEQARGEGHAADRRSDVYSAGVILFQLLTGELPFRGELRMLLVQILTEDPPSPRKLRADVPRDLETITLKCLEKDQAKRYQTALDLASDLRRFLAAEPISARPVGRTERVWRWCKRNPAIASLSASLLALLTTVAIVAPIVAIQQSRLRLDYSDQLAATRLELASEEYNAGHELEGIALLSRAYEAANPSYRDSIRGMLSGWSREISRPIIHDAALTSAAFSPDGRTILIGGHDPLCTARLWDARTNLPFGQSLQHSKSVRAVAFSPDGLLAVTGSEDRTAQLWDAKTGNKIGPPMSHGDLVWAVAFSPDGQVLVTVGKDKVARCWNVHTGQPIGDPIEHDAAVFAVAFSPDGRTIVTGSGNGPSGTAQIWDVETRKLIYKAEEFRGTVFAVAFSPDGSKIVAGCGDRKAHLYDAKTFAPLGELVGHQDVVYAVAFTPDGRRLLTGSHDRTARFWNIKEGRDFGKPIGEPLGHEGWVMSVAISPDGRMALTASADRTARLWNIVDGRVLEHQAAIRCQAFAPDNKVVATGGEDATARLWDVRTGQPLTTLAHDSPVVALAFSSDGQQLFSASEDRKVRSWDVTTGNSATALQIDTPTKAFHFASDGRSVLVQSSDGSVRLWDALAREPLSKLIALDLKEAIVALSPDAHTLLAWRSGASSAISSDGQLFNLQSGAKIGAPMQYRIISAVFTHDGRTVLTADFENEVRLWNAQTGESARDPLQHEGVVDTVAISADGKMALGGSRDSKARLWDLVAGKPLGRPLEHPSPVKHTAISPGGQIALTICNDGSAHLWDIRTCKPQARPLRFEAPIDDGAFSPDGSVILFQCADGTARLYDVPQGLADDPKMIRTWARARTGFEITDQGAQQLRQSKWLATEEELKALEENR